MDNTEILIEALKKVKGKWEHAEFHINIAGLVNRDLLKTPDRKLNDKELKAKRGLEHLILSIAKSDGFLIEYFGRKGIKGTPEQALKEKDIFKYIEKHLKRQK